MPHLYLHIRDGQQVIQDPEGESFADLDAARRKAIQAARELVSERVTTGQGFDDQAIVVADESGHVVLMVPFSEAIQPDR